MEDDGGIATTVVMKARSAYTWLDKLRFLKGLLPQEASVDFACKFLRVWHCGIRSGAGWCDIVEFDGGGFVVLWMQW